MNLSAVRVVRVEPMGGSAQGVHVHLSEGDPLEVPIQAWLESGLHAGAELDAKAQADLQRRTRHWRARNAALNLLSYRARSRRELVTALRKKGHAFPELESVLDDLEARGLLDDAGFAEALVRDRIRHRPRGNRRLLSELREKGVDGTTAERAVARAMTQMETDEDRLAEEVGRHWARTQSIETLETLTRTEFSPERQKVSRRLYGHLARRGFGGQALRCGVEAAGKEAAERLAAGP
jgi:regulatory protein